MSNSPYPSSSEPNVNQPPMESTNVSRYAELDRTVQDIRIENSRLDHDVKQLKDRTSTLIGLIVGLIFLMIGGFTWLAISLQNLEKEEQQGSNGVAPAILGRVEQLDKQVNELNQNIPGNLTETLQSNQKSLTELQTQLQQVTTQIKALEKASSSAQPQPNVSPAAPPSNQKPTESPQPTNSP